MPTLEDAKHCPRCDMPGEEASSVPITEGRRMGGKVLNMKCVNDRCRWFNSHWIIQVNPDGSIPEYKPGPKQFVTSDVLRKAAQRELEKAAEELRIGELPSINDIFPQ